MTSHRGILILAAPAVLGGVALAAIVASRPERPPVIRRTVDRRCEPPPPRREDEERAALPLPSRSTPIQVSPADEISRAVEDVRLESTYRNYRAAVATSNKAVQDSLHQVLMRDREAALKVAQTDMTNARTDVDRDIAKRTLESLRR